ncbi:all-trans retinoic acid-induced differentiation factor-like isoform X1 [Acropora millepora]|uniref:all-trans retinoic acid-induced differentiation factor-like isoform X1 n=2 Tax=Acropora millepora TaxID=45264 RepID=UPI001CF55C90|nr:all-trans retinoic acid-induced differentiation factor-like isoform X1 [Acropora millepora]
MIRNFFKIFAKFTLFCFLFVAKTSFGSLQWRMSGDPSQPTICSRSCNGENTTSLCGKHSVIETTRKRCCVEEGVVVGLDLSNCSITAMPTLKSVKMLRWIYLSDNPNLDCDDKTFLSSFKGLKNLSEVVLPRKCNCTGGNYLWRNSSVIGSQRWCEEQRTNSCRILNVTCPSNSHCLSNGPGLTECLCNTGWFGYKCLVKHGFPWALIFASIGGTTVFLIAVVMFHQRKRRKENAFKFRHYGID